MKNKKYEYSTDYNLLTQMKTWIAVNPSFGCIWDCAYCIQHKDAFFDTAEYRRVHKVKTNKIDFTPEEIIAEIMRNPRVTKRTPLTLYNFSDPFLPQNTSDLVKILEGMDKRKFKQVVGLMTKTNVPDTVLDSIANLKNLRLIIYVSYAGYDDRRIESAPNNKRLELMKRINDRGIPTIQYLRPVVKEWVKEGQIERISQEVKGIIDGVVMSGLRLTPEIISKIKSKNLPVPKVANHKNKYFPVELQEQIVEAYRDVAPVYRYTSCAASAVFNIPDYNAHMDFLRVVGKIRQEDGCPLPCISAQKQRCFEYGSENRTTEEQIRKLQEKIGYEDKNFKITNKGRVIFEEPMSKEDLTFFRHNTSRHVDYEDNQHYLDAVHKTNGVNK